MSETIITIKVFASREARDANLWALASISAHSREEFDQAVNDHITDFLLYESPAGKAMTWQGARFVLQQQDLEREKKDTGQQ